MYFFLTPMNGWRFTLTTWRIVFSFLGGYGCIDWRFQWKANQCIQSIRPFIFVVPYQLPKLRCSFRLLLFLPGCFFRWRMESSWEAQGPKRGGKSTTWAPKQGWLFFLLRDLFCKHSLDSLRKNLISWKKSDEICWNISFIPKMTFIDV